MIAFIAEHLSHTHAGTTTLQPFTTSSASVSGGTQTTTDTTTRIVVQGPGSQGPGTLVSVTGPIENANNIYAGLSGAPTLPTFTAEQVANTCHANANAGFSVQVTGVTAETDVFNFTPTA